jgi:hypothetical protein
MPLHHLLEQIWTSTLSPQASRADSPCSRGLIHWNSSDRTSS